MAQTIDQDLSRRRRIFFFIVGAAVIVTIIAVGLLMNIFERKQEARNPFYRVVELNDTIDDPAIWAKDFPMQYDLYMRTVDMQRTKYGGSEAMPHSPTDADPRSVVAGPSSRKIRASKSCGPDILSRRIIGSAADMPTCSMTRHSPSDRSSIRLQCASTATPRWLRLFCSLAMATS